MSDEIIEAELVEETTLPAIVETEPERLIQAGFYLKIETHLPKEKWEIAYVPENHVVPAKPGTTSHVLVAIEERTTTYTLDLHTWETYWEGPLPDDILDQRLAELGQEFTALQELAAANTHALQTYRPHMLPTGELGGVGLVPSDAQTPEEARRGIKLRSNEVEKTALKMAETSQAIAKLLGAKSAVIKAQIEAKAALMKRDSERMMAQMKAQIESMQAMLKKAKEALWTINLYLGTDEEILSIREGRPASAQEPIRIQQTVLFMDEECGLVSEKLGGGINASNLDLFSEWLLADPMHLSQIIPFERGIVALKPRRKARSYKHVDPLTAVQMQKEDASTYFLFRNGENLYYMWTEFDAGEVLVPRKTEFLQFFPGLATVGDEQYMEALKHSTALSAHWLRVGLIIQGLIDRTTIFTPIEHKPNILLASDYGNGVEFINDMETMLNQGLPAWDDYLKAINAKLELGCRVVGTFGYYSDWGMSTHLDGEGRYRKNNRISPRGASSPADNAIYEIDGKDGRFLTFKFERTRDWRDYEKRATCRICPEDEFIINIDAADPELLERFLNDRANRHNYERMFPVIRAAISVLKAEAEQEAPFRDLLQNNLGCSTEALDWLVHWYKFKNRYHRALTTQDALAFRMIKEEYPNYMRRKAQEDVVKARGVKFAEWVFNEVPGTFLVAHVKDNEYRVVSRMNADNVFVNIGTWTISGDTYRHKEDKPWSILTNSYWRWFVLWKDEAVLKSWAINANPNEFLTDPETDQLTQAFLARLTETGYRCLLIRKTWAGVTQGLCWSKSSHYRTEFTVKTPYWGKTSTGGVVLKDIFEGDRTFTRETDPCRVVIVEPTRHDYNSPSYTKKILWQADASEWQAWEDHVKKVKAEEAKEKEVGKILDRIMGVFDARRKQEIREEVWAKFAADHGDPDLWEGYQKQHKAKFESDFNSGLRHQTWSRELKKGQDKTYNVDLRAALHRLLLTDVNVEGMTVRAVLANYDGEPEEETKRERGQYGGYREVKTGRILHVKQDDTQEFLLDWPVSFGEGE